MLGLQAVPPCLSCPGLGMELKGFLYARQTLLFLRLSPGPLLQWVNPEAHCLHTAYFSATLLPHSVQAPHDGVALLLNLTTLLLIWQLARDSPSVPRVGINLQWVHTDINYSESKSLLRNKYLHVSGKCFQMTSLRFFCFKVSLWWISREWRCTGRV